MTTSGGPGGFEYPDAAGYPDGRGVLDEGTTELVDEVTASAVRGVDEPSADSDVEIAVRRLDDRGVFSATIDGREVASLRYAAEGDRIVALTTTVLPQFRGRGIATALIADSLDDIRDDGLRLVVRCPVVAAFIDTNRQYADLVD